jgi:hypothetical protein
MTLLETYIHVAAIPLTIIVITAHLVYRWLKRKQDR